MTENKIKFDLDPVFVLIFRLSDQQSCVGQLVLAIHYSPDTVPQLGDNEAFSPAQHVI